jgi:hypothetical protein
LRPTPRSVGRNRHLSIASAYGKGWSVGRNRHLSIASAYAANKTSAPLKKGSFLVSVKFDYGKNSLAFAGIHWWYPNFPFLKIKIPPETPEVSSFCFI